MKYIAPALLVGYAIYSVTAQVTIAHSIILFSLAALFAFQTFVSHRQENIKLLATLEQMKEELIQDWGKHKEANDKKIAQLEDDVAKISLNTTTLRNSSSSSKPQTRKEVIF